MNITKDTVVTLHYKLSDAQGNLIEESREPMVYLHGGYGNTLPKIEAALDGQAVGYQTQLQVEPEDAFGEYDADLVKVEPRNLFPEDVEVGMQFEGGPEEGSDEEFVIYRVTDIADDKVVLTDLANWTQATGANSTFTSNGHTYDVWNHNSKSLQLLIDHSILQSNITAS